RGRGDPPPAFDPRRAARAARHAGGHGGGSEGNGETSKSHVISPPTLRWSPVFLRQTFSLADGTTSLIGEDRSEGASGGHSRPSSRSSRRSASGMFLAPGAARSRSRGASFGAR